MDDVNDVHILVNAHVSIAVVNKNIKIMLYVTFIGSVMHFNFALNLNIESVVDITNAKQWLVSISKLRSAPM